MTAPSGKMKANSEALRPELSVSGVRRPRWEQDLLERAKG